MEAHAVYSGQFRDTTEHGRLGARSLVRVGAIAGLAGGLMMAMWQMIAGAIAKDPTAVPGIHTSFWTAVTSIPSVVFGQNWFHGSFEFWAVFLGLMGHMMNSMMLGVLGVGLMTALLGRRPNVLGAMAVGVMFGLVLEVAIVNGLVNGVLQSVHTLYTSTPKWSWWVAHGLFGGTLGVLGAVLLRRRST
jgi:hypothetical protein